MQILKTFRKLQESTLQNRTIINKMGNGIVILNDGSLNFIYKLNFMFN